MTFEKRVLAAKAKLNEAAIELLELVSQSPSAAGDICQILNPSRPATPNPDRQAIPGVECREFWRSQIIRDGVTEADDELELTPYSYVFEHRKIDREDNPDVLIIKGGVFLALSLYPEDEVYSEKMRRLSREGEK